MRKQAVVFFAWGEKYIQEVKECVEGNAHLVKYDLFLITDMESAVDISGLNVIRADFTLDGLLRKTEIWNHLPEQYDTFLFLDSDTRVIEDISFGFEKAELFEIAMAPAPHYSLDHFWEFNKVMELENVCCRGQLQYNTGVIFFRNSPAMKSLFSEWSSLALKHQDILANDQPFLTLALEMRDFNPYTLSISYNYRGFGDAISGIVRVWHSHGKMPVNINEFEKPWPPRKAVPGRVIHPKNQ